MKGLFIALIIFSIVILVIKFIITIWFKRKIRKIEKKLKNENIF